MFAAVNVRVSTVAKADVRGRVVVVVVVSDTVKRRAVKITLTCFNSFHIFCLLQFKFFPGRRNMNTVGIQKSVNTPAKCMLLFWLEYVYGIVTM